MDFPRGGFLCFVGLSNLVGNLLFRKCPMEFPAGVAGGGWRSQQGRSRREARGWSGAKEPPRSTGCPQIYFRAGSHRQVSCRVHRLCAACRGLPRRDFWASEGLQVGLPMLPVLSGHLLTGCPACLPFPRALLSLLQGLALCVLPPEDPPFKVSGPSLCNPSRRRKTQEAIAPAPRA